MAENLDPGRFEIEEEDILRIRSMPPVGWSGEHPDRARVKIQA